MQLHDAGLLPLDRKVSCKFVRNVVFQRLSTDAEFARLSISHDAPVSLHIHLHISASFCLSSASTAGSLMPSCSCVRTSLSRHHAGQCK